MAGIRFMPSGFGAVAPMSAPSAATAKGRVPFVDEVNLTVKSMGSAACGSWLFVVCSEQVGQW
jgi:hypothetical protein